MGFTRDGSLWCAGLEGLVRFHQNRFDVIMRENVIAFLALPDEVYVRGNALTRIGLDGSIRQLPHMTRKELQVDSTGRIWSMCIRPERGCWIDPKNPDESHTLEVPSGLDELLRDVKGRIWGAEADKAMLIENGRPIPDQQQLRQHSREKDRPGPLVMGRNNQIWFVGETIRGLIWPVEFRDRAEYDRFAPVSGFEDSQGHLGRSGRAWIAGVDPGP